MRPIFEEIYNEDVFLMDALYENDITYLGSDYNLDGYLEECAKHKHPLVFYYDRDLRKKNDQLWTKMLKGFLMFLKMHNKMDPKCFNISSKKPFEGILVDYDRHLHFEKHPNRAKYFKKYLHIVNNFNFYPNYIDPCAEVHFIKQNRISISDIRMLEQTFLLDLSSNWLCSLNDFMLYNLRFLKILDLSSNQIMHIQDGSFGAFNLLETLNLSGNSIKELSDKTFSGA